MQKYFLDKSSEVEAEMLNAHDYKTDKRTYGSEPSDMNDIGGKF